MRVWKLHKGDITHLRELKPAHLNGARGTDETNLSSQKLFKSSTGATYSDGNISCWISSLKFLSYCR